MPEPTNTKAGARQARPWAHLRQHHRDDRQYAPGAGAPSLSAQRALSADLVGLKLEFFNPLETAVKGSHRPSA